MLYFPRWQDRPHPDRRAGRVHRHTARISFPRKPSRAGRTGCRSSSWCSASTCRAAPICSMRSTASDYVAAAPADARQRRPQGAAPGSADRLHRPRRPGRGRAAPHPRSRQARRCAQASRSAPQSADRPRSSAAASVNEFDLTVDDDGLARFTYSPAGLTAARPRHRRPVDRGHQPPHQRTRHDRAEHPAPGRRPHPGRGARPRRSGRG